MSIKEVSKAIHESSLKKDGYFQAISFCREAAREMMKAAKSADKTLPHVDIQILAYPKAQSSEDTHYAIRAINPEGDMIFNINRASGFPIYLGDFQSAPGLLSQMKVVEKVL
jgi:hypothetical protein